MADLIAPPHRYVDPWDRSFSSRYQDFMKEERRVAYYAHEPNASTFRYRCYGTSQSINDHLPGISSSYFWKEDGAKLLDVAKEADVLILGRTTYTWELAQLVTVAREWGSRVLFDVDDLVVDPSRVLELVQGLDLLANSSDDYSERVWDDWFAYTGRERAALELTEGVVTTNKYLSDRIAETSHLPVAVVPNFMCNEQLWYSRDLRNMREAQDPGAETQTLHLGYFSGTPSHSKDFALVTPALAAVMKTRPHVRLRIVGFVDIGGTELEEVSERVDYHPLTDFMNLQRLIASTQINIAPLQDTVFHNCKSELKYFDAAAVMTPTLASPTFTMRQAIRNGENGLLVKDADWKQALTEVLDDYAGLGRRMGRAASNHALATYTGAQQASAIARALGLG